MTIKLAKSKQTLQAIVKAALHIAVTEGLHSVTLGEVSKRMGISKSGVFARVGSLESLQVMVIQEYSDQFIAEVFRPALLEPRGLPRLNAIIRLWIARGSGDKAMTEGLHATASFDFAHVKSALRDKVHEAVMAWRELFQGAVVLCVKEGHFQPDTDASQIAFEINGLMIGFLHDARFFRDPNAHERALAACRRLILTYCTPAAPSSAA